MTISLPWLPPLSHKIRACNKHFCDRRGHFVRGTAVAAYKTSAGVVEWDRGPDERGHCAEKLDWPQAWRLFVCRGTLHRHRWCKVNVLLDIFAPSTNTLHINLAHTFVPRRRDLVLEAPYGHEGQVMWCTMSGRFSSSSLSASPEFAVHTRVSACVPVSVLFVGVLRACVCLISFMKNSKYDWQSVQTPKKLSWDPMWCSRPPNAAQGSSLRGLFQGC